MIQLAGLHRDVRRYAELAHNIAHYLGLRPVVTSVIRDWNTQWSLRKQYEDCPPSAVYPGNPNPKCRYPANEPGDSAHQYGLAWDSWVPAEEMDLWRRIRAYVGFRVPPHDPIHAEVPNWRSYVQ